MKIKYLWAVFELYVKIYEQLAKICIHYEPNAPEIE